MSSSKLPQTGVVAISPFILGTQLFGIILVAFISAILFYRYIRKNIC